MNFLNKMAGCKLAESDIPRGIKALERIADALERLADQKEQGVGRAVPIFDLDNLTNFLSMKEQIK